MYRHNQPGKDGWSGVRISVFAAALCLLAGCGYGNSAGAGSGLSAGGALSSIQGQAHVGSQPVAFMSLKLYAAGSTGYGSAGTLLATTTTVDDAAGSFQFSKDPASSTAYPNTGSTFSCPNPATAGDPLLYIIGSGGNTQNTHLNDSANTNTAAGLILVLGPCSTVASAYVFMNEVSSAATIFSLAQYMNPGSTPGTESIGTNGLNLVSSGALPQAAVGLNNAAASIANLVNVSSGAAVTSNSYAGSATAVAGVTVTVTPETAKLVTIADVLASCSTAQTAAAANCTKLFNAATPPPTVSRTSQPSATFAKAQDEIQAAYYMAVNPADLGTQTTTCGTGITTNAACLYSLASTTSTPFGTALASAPLDWTLALTYTSAGACGDAGGFISQLYHGAVDAMGNIWMIAGANNATSSHMIEISPTGQPLNCVPGLNQGRGLTIDVAGNVWGVSFGANNAIEYTPSGHTVNWPTAFPGFAMTADGNGNVFYTSDSGAGTLNEFAGAATATTPATDVTVGSTGVATGAELYQAKVDTLGRIYVPDFNTHVWQFYPVSSGGLNGYAVADIAAPIETGSSQTAYFYGAAIDSGNNLYVGSRCCGSSSTTSKYYKKLVKFTPSNGSATASVSPQYLGGVNGVNALTIDGAGNVWAASDYPATGTVDHPGMYALAEDYATGTGTGASWFALSPAASNATNLTTSGTNFATLCSKSADADGGCPEGGGFQHASLLENFDLQADISGNVWAFNTGSESSVSGAQYGGNSIVEIVGAAVPVSAPLSVAAKNGTLGAKP